ncbi:MAG: alpha-(1-_3)-arabinofuranosyltransferase family protein [Acidimicrobiales bacterium]
MSTRSRRVGPLAVFTALCYLPLLATSPGQVVADTKSYLYLDPGRLLSRAWSMWDPQVGMGTVTHQNIGFLWPMGPYYWLMEHVGVPDWMAQRLWLGSIILAAGLGVRFMLRTFGWRGPGLAPAMCAYAFTPYLLSIAPRISAILLPFAALPWMIALAARATRSGGWRHPAVFALVVATVGTSNATALLLAGLGPVLWLMWAAIVREHSVRRVALTAGRIGVLTLATNAWWIAGLSVQATHGVDVLRYTESVATTAAASSATEVLRGLGYWFFYGDDALGPWIGPSKPYQTSLWLLAVTFAVPVLALAGGALSRWRHRSFAVLLLLVGMALSVGVYPYRDPSPFGRLLRGFLESDVGMAMRSMPRATPLVVLSLSIMLGAGVHALASRFPRAALPAAIVAIGLVLAGVPPLWQRTLVPENLRRPEEIPHYWVEAARHLDATDDGTRVLEVPGADFTSYRWGTTLDPVTPGLTDRPVVARELVPMGSAAAWNLLKAFDGRLQANVAESTSVAPMARTMRAGEILLRSDLQYEHYDTPRPRNLWRFLVGAPGLGPATEFGTPTANVAEAPAPMVDELELSTSPGRDPFPVTVLSVPGALPVVVAKPTSVPVVVAGDGEGLVDSAAAGLIDGTELLRYSASMTDADLRRALADGAALVVTDTNRRRGERWGSIRFTSGYTEPSGLVPLRVDRSDARLPIFPDATDADRTIAVHRGGVTANATSYGRRNEYLPEHRPSNAVDDDPSTAWRTSQDDPVRGERLDLTLDRAITAETVRFLAPPAPINRWVTRVALRFDGGAPIERNLDVRSRQEPGQAVDIGRRTFTRLTIEILEDSVGPRPRYGGLTSTGFAEVHIGHVRLDEAIRPPTDLLDRAGARSLAHPLAVVLTRLRSAATDVERLDEEQALVRILDLPGPREFGLTGTARLSPRAADEVLNRLLGGDAAGWSAVSSSRMGPVATWAGSAIDGDLATSWTTAYGDQTRQWIDVSPPTGQAGFERLDLAIVADGRHSVPTRIGVEADGTHVASLRLPSLKDRPTPGATTSVRLALPEPVVATKLRLVIDEVRSIETTDWSTRKIRQLPVALAEVDLPGISRVESRGPFTTGCRTDLLTVQAAPVRVIISGTTEDALAGNPLAIHACDDRPLRLAASNSELRAERGSLTGVDVDRIVLRSTPGGSADTSDSTLRATSATTPTPVPRLTTLESSPDTVTLRVDDAQPGQPFWLAFGQGWSDGWTATGDGLAAGAPLLVDGFANGWRIEPTATTFEVSLRFAPQRRVDLALWGSLVAALGCIALALRRPRPLPAVPEVGPVALVTVEPNAAPLTVRMAVAVALSLTALGVLVASPAVGAAAGALALLSGRGGLPRWATALAAPAAMAVSAGYVVVTVARHQIAPGLEWPAELHRAHPFAWFAVLALVVDAVVIAIRTSRHR